MKLPPAVSEGSISEMCSLQGEWGREKPCSLWEGGVSEEAPPPGRRGFGPFSWAGREIPEEGISLQREQAAKGAAGASKHISVFGTVGSNICVVARVAHSNNTTVLLPLGPAAPTCAQ